MTRAIMKIGRADTTAEVDVYRDGSIVTVVARGEALRDTPYGNVRTQGVVSQQYQTVEAFEYDRDRLKTSKRFALAYPRIKEYLGVDDDARSAPPLPEGLRHLLPAHMRRLPQQQQQTQPRWALGRGSR